MLATLAVPLLVCVIGLLVFALAANAKTAEAGRLAYFCGLFWCIYLVAHAAVSVRG